MGKFIQHIHIDGIHHDDSHDHSSYNNISQQRVIAQLAAFGLYGMTAFLVAQRTREIAIRMALGSTREAVLRLILWQCGRLALAGTAAGIALAIGASVLLSSFLIGLKPVDPIAFAAATSLMSATMAWASIVPARRAARMDPMRALRAE